jgi:hypothetical protein
MLCHVEAHRQHAVFLLVMPASMDPRVAPVMEIVTAHKLQSNSIGVFTKCDDLAEKKLKKQFSEQLVCRRLCYAVLCCAVLC